MPGLTSTQQGLFNHLQAPYMQGQYHQLQGAYGNQFIQDLEKEHRRVNPGAQTSSSHSPVKRSVHPKPYRDLELLGDLSYSFSPTSLILNRRTGQESVGGDLSAPLSPISESAIDERKPGSSNPRSVSAAVSDESVAGDSGVFEASSKKEDLGLSMNVETAQVQIKLRYSSIDSLLHIGIEKARNLTVLFIPEGRQV